MTQVATDKADNKAFADCRRDFFQRVGVATRYVKIEGDKFFIDVSTGETIDTLPQDQLCTFTLIAYSHPMFHGEAPRVWLTPFL